MPNATASISLSDAKYITKLNASSHDFIADEPVADGGQNTGPNPKEFLLSALGACTSITVRMYAERKGWPLKELKVELSLEPKETGTLIKRNITITGDLTPEQRERLMSVANACPVHKILTNPISIESEMV